MLELSKAVQRVINVERNANKDLRKELATLKAAAAAKIGAQPTREVRKHSDYACVMPPIASVIEILHLSFRSCHAVPACERSAERSQDCLRVLGYV